MELSEIIPHIEALIFASDRPLTSLEIVEMINNAFGFMEQQISLDQVDTALDGIREKYSSAYYPFEVLQSGGGWQFLSKPSFHTTIAQLNAGKFLKKLSNAAMETLSIIAYKQPITKGEIESIRGVNSDYSVQKLLEKELIVISGRNEELPGKPLIYETSKNFMDYFGLNSVDDLPKIKEVLAEQMVEPLVQERNIESDQDFGIFKKENQVGGASEVAVEQQSGEDEAISGKEVDETETNDTAFAADQTSNESVDDQQPEEDFETSEEEELADQEMEESIAHEQQEMENELHPDLDNLEYTEPAITVDEAEEKADSDDALEMTMEEELADEFTAAENEQEEGEYEKNVDTRTDEDLEEEEKA